MNSHDRTRTSSRRGDTTFYPFQTEGPLSNKRMKSGGRGPKSDQETLVIRPEDESTHLSTVVKGTLIIITTYHWLLGLQ